MLDGRLLAQSADYCTYAFSGSPWDIGPSVTLDTFTRITRMEATAHRQCESCGVDE